MNLIDLGGIAFVGIWIILSCRYIYRQKKAGKCVGCNGCKGSSSCASCQK